LAFVYFEEEPGRRAAAKLLTRDEAHRITANIAKHGNVRLGSKADVTPLNFDVRFTLESGRA
jgi:hypothetical protein